MKSEKILKLLLLAIVVLITTIAVLIMPDMANTMAVDYQNFSSLKNPGLIILYISLIPFYIMIFEIWKLLKMVEGHEMFSISAVKSLDKIKYCSACIFAIYLLVLIYLLCIRIQFSAAYLTIIVTSLAALAGALFSSILKKLLLIAIDYKTENDLTI
ncbi:MAG: DUF2975 domain-containing protein [Tissierellia bacterium]|nr:DUF2975 domain-containing protein [Tissierellia bacterium]